MSTTSVNCKLVKSFDHIVKSSQDQRLYRGLLLDNGLKCLLISDPQTDRSAASVDVNTGHMLDPHEFLGLAHFCEHMLFMGSKKYPEENKFSKFIDEHAGSTNAYTANENTNYHFEVATPNFKEALDIFAQFFISPLFDVGSVDREILAVDSENQKNLQSDLWRIDQLEKSTCRPDHPYSKFGTGNLQTLKEEPGKLGLNVRDELIKFHSQYYSANLMTLCMLGKESLDELQQYAVDMFSEIPNKNLPRITFDSDPFGKEALTKVNYVVPVKDIRQMSLQWVTPDYRDQYEKSPHNYISHLVGHEGSGSLLSELKRKGWCNSIYAGARSEARGFQLFNLTADLSEDGGENIDEILKLVYQYLNVIKKDVPSKWVFDELNDLARIKFMFKDKEKPISYVSSLAADMHVYDMDHVLTSSYYSTTFDPELIQSIFGYLEPTKMRMTVVSKKYEGQTDKTEKWYGTQYKTEAYPPEKVSALLGCGHNEAFKLPLKNEFIPQDLSLVKHETDPEATSKFPRVVHSDQLHRVWYKEDTKFLLPKAVFKCELRNPLAYHDPVSVNMVNLFIDLLDDALTEYSYEAVLAGLSYRIEPTSYGLNIILKGFNDKMPILLETVIEKMATFKIDPQRFEILRELYQRKLLNFEAEQPYQHSVYFMTHLLGEKGWTKQQLANCINDFTMSDLQQFIPKLLTQGVFIESVIFGNLTQQKAVEMIGIVENKLKLALNETKLPRLRALEAAYMNNFRQIKLPDASSHVFVRHNKVHKTVGIEVYFQCGVQSTPDNAKVELFCQVISESCFNILRTQEQLGYIVFSGVRLANGAQGVRLIIQSDRSPVYLDERIENFIQLTKENLEKMTDDEFKQHVEALILTKLEEPKKMSHQLELYWNEVVSHQYNFDRENIEVEEIKKLTKQDVVDFFNRYIDPCGPERRKLAVYICPPDMSEDLKSEKIKDKLIENPYEWKSSQSLYPNAKPFIKVPPSNQ